MNERKFLFFFSIIVFLSGVAGLSYELLWIRSIRGYFGDETLSVALVIFIYFSGLGIGGFLSRYPLQRKIPPCIVYSAAECLLAIYGLLFPLIISAAHNFFLIVSGLLPPDYWLIAKIVIITCILIVPTSLIGLTLPLIAAAGVLKPSSFTARFSHYYSLNTLGAVTGLLLTGMYLIPGMGLAWTGRVIALCNVAVALMLYLGVKRAPAPDYAVIIPEGAPRTKAVFPALIAFLLGMTALSYEVVWIRIFSYYFISSTFALSILLGMFIAGFALGSMLLSKRRKRISIVQFGFIELINAIVMMAMFLTIRHFFYLHWGAIARSLSANYSFEHITRYTVLFAAAALLLPGICMGMTFPLIERAWPSDNAGTGRIAGIASAWNTWGGACGAFLAGFLFIPWLGTAGTLKLSIIMAIGTAILLIIKNPGYRYGAAIAIIMVPIVMILPGELNLSRTAGKNPNSEFYKEGRTASVSVVKNKFNEKILSINNTYTLGSNDFESVRLQWRQGALPVILSRDKQGAILSIGVGTGITVASLYENSIAKKVDAVEIVPEVVDASKLFSTDNNFISNNKNITMVTGDGREFLALSHDNYGIIFAELYSPEFAGIGNLYSYEHLCAIRDHLTGNGIFCQCLSLYQFNVETFRIFIRTFTEVFGRGAVWLVDSDPDFPTVIVTSAPDTFWTPKALEQGLDRYSKEKQAVLAWQDPADIGAHFITDDLQNLAKGETRINSINNPFIEEISGRSVKSSNRDEMLYLLSNRNWPSCWNEWKEGHDAWKLFGDMTGTSIEFFNRHDFDEYSLNSYLNMLDQIPDSLSSFRIIKSNAYTRIIDYKIVKSAYAADVTGQKTLSEEILKRAGMLDPLNYTRDFKLFTFYHSSNETEKALAAFRSLWDKIPDGLKADGIFPKIHALCSLKEKEPSAR